MQSLQQLYYVLISLLFGAFIHFVYSLFFYKLKHFISLIQTIFFTFIGFAYITLLEKNDIEFNRILIFFIVLGYLISYFFLTESITKTLDIFYHYLNYLKRIISKLLKFLLYPYSLRYLVKLIKDYRKKRKERKNHIMRRPKRNELF